MKCSFVRGQLDKIVELPRDVEIVGLEQFCCEVAKAYGYQWGGHDLFVDVNEMEVSEDLFEVLAGVDTEWPRGNDSLKPRCVAVSTRCFDRSREWTVVELPDGFNGEIPELFREAAGLAGMNSDEEGAMFDCKEIEVSPRVIDVLYDAYKKEGFKAADVSALLMISGPKVNDCLSGMSAAVSSRFVFYSSEEGSIQLEVKIVPGDGYTQVSIAGNGTSCEYGDEVMTAEDCGKALADHLRTYCGMR